LTLAKKDGDGGVPNRHEEMLLQQRRGGAGMPSQLGEPGYRGAGGRRAGSQRASSGRAACPWAASECFRS